MNKYLFETFIFITTALAFFSPEAFAQKDESIIQKSSEIKSISAIEQAVINEINTVRTDPKKYIGYLEEYEKFLRGKIVYLPGTVPLETTEGSEAIKDAIKDLKKVSKLEPLNISYGLSKAANLQLKDLMQDLALGHTGKYGSTLTQRVAKFGRIGNRYAENIAYQSDTARDFVLTMIIDDGLKSRTHRKNILSRNFKLIGVAFGKGKNDMGLCVVVFADIFTETTQKTTARQIR